MKSSQILAIVLSLSVLAFGQCRPLDGRLEFEPIHPHSRTGASQVRTGSKGGEVFVEVESSDHVDLRFASSDYGATWRRVHSLPPSTQPQRFSVGTFAVRTDSKLVYKNDGTQQLYLSRDGGATWRRQEVRLFGEKRAPFGVSLSALDPEDPLKIYGVISDRSKRNLPNLGILPGIYVSSDAGRTWRLFTRQVNILPFTGALAISQRNPHVMMGQGLLKLLISSDGGQSWSPIAPPLLPNAHAKRAEDTSDLMRHSGGVVQLQFSPFDASTVYAVLDSGVFRSRDRGISWCLFDLGRDVWRGYNSLAIDAADKRKIYVASTFGLFYSENGGDTFRDITPRSAVMR